MLLQEECELVKIDINCHIQGDVVLECISLHDDREIMMFRTMFNTSFIQSNILILNSDEVDTLWDAKDQFPKDFRIEVSLFSLDSLFCYLYVRSIKKHNSLQLCTGRRFFFQTWMLLLL